MCIVWPLSGEQETKGRQTAYAVMAPAGIDGWADSAPESSGEKTYSAQGYREFVDETVSGVVWKVNRERPWYLRVYVL